jgi:hypothetical protein
MWAQVAFHMGLQYSTPKFEQDRTFKKIHSVHSCTQVDFSMLWFVKKRLVETVDTWINGSSYMDLGYESPINAKKYTLYRFTV